MRTEIQLSDCKLARDEFKEDYFFIYNHRMPHPVSIEEVEWLILVKELARCFGYIERHPNLVVDKSLFCFKHNNNISLFTVIKPESLVYLKILIKDYCSRVDVSISADDCKEMTNFVVEWMSHTASLRETEQLLEKIVF
jgi:hypothetical protein